MRSTILVGKFTAPICEAENTKLRCRRIGVCEKGFVNDAGSLIVLVQQETMIPQSVSAGSERRCLNADFGLPALS
jgi:hypothetical protein